MLNGDMFCALHIYIYIYILYILSYEELIRSSIIECFMIHILCVGTVMMPCIIRCLIKNIENQIMQMNET